MILKVILVFSIFTIVLYAQTYPKIYQQLSKPLFQAEDFLNKYTFIEDLDVKDYAKQAKVIKEEGFALDSKQDKSKAKEYLGKLRVLQKEYESLLFVIHTYINRAIDNQDYPLFIKLTDSKLDGLLEKRRLYTKSLAFYKKNKHKHKIYFFEEKIENEKIRLATSKELFHKVSTARYNPQNTKSKKKVILDVVGNKNYFKVYLENKNPYSVTVKVNGTYKNFDYNAEQSTTISLKSKERKEYIRLDPKKGVSSYSYGFNYSWIMGSKDAIHNDAYIYRLPYAKGNSVRVSQGFNGKTTHNGRSQYAVDFAMPVGTKIYASRAGKVVKLKEDSNKGGYAREFSKYGNYVTIEHEDNTLATYYHLKQNGVVAKIGERVSKGELLAYSGNTGYSSGPHLHFAVFKAKNANSTKTIKIKFLSDKGTVFEMVKGKIYTSK